MKTGKTDFFPHLFASMFLPESLRFPLGFSPRLHNVLPNKWLLSPSHSFTRRSSASR